MDSLRAVGCPEDKIRTIIKADIEELFLKKKQKLAVENDRKWWAADYRCTYVVNTMAEKGQRLEEERRDLLAKLLGAEATQKDDFENLQWGPVELSGPVLGSLTPKSTTRCRKFVFVPRSVKSTTRWRTRIPAAR